MCWFVTLGVPHPSRAVASSVFELHRRVLHFNWLTSTPTTRLFPDNTSCVEVTHGGCSCGIYSERQEDAEAQIAKERSRLVGKGWSASKVERALESRMQSKARPTPRSAAEAGFRELVAGIVREIGVLAVYAHFYSGNQHTADVQPAGKVVLSLQSFARDGFPADTVTTVCTAS